MLIARGEAVLLWVMGGGGLCVDLRPDNGGRTGDGSRSFEMD